MIVTYTDWIRIGKIAGWSEDSGNYNKLDTQLFPENVGKAGDRDVVKKHRKNKKAPYRVDCPDSGPSKRKKRCS